MKHAPARGLNFLRLSLRSPPQQVEIVSPPLVGLIIENATGCPPRGLLDESYTVAVKVEEPVVLPTLAGTIVGDAWSTNFGRCCSGRHCHGKSILSISVGRVVNLNVGNSRVSCSQDGVRLSSGYVFVTTVDVESHKPIVVAKVTCVMPEGALTLMFSEWEYRE